MRFARFIILVFLTIFIVAGVTPSGSFPYHYVVGQPSRLSNTLMTGETPVLRLQDKDVAEAATPNSSNLDALFPLSGEAFVTSSFGEFRLNHPHGGIDLRADEGTPVFAPNDGYVWRIRTTCYGNGKSLYIKGDDGKIYTFLHLSGFEPKIFEKIFAEQLKTLRYTQDVFLEPTDIRVKREELVAYAGKTGTDVSHLHYEVRDKNNCPTNPLMSHTLSDDEPPKIKRIALVPIGVNSTVEHKTRPAMKTPRSGAVEFSASGKVGIAVEIEDKIPPSNYELAPYKVVLNRGEEVLFAVEMRGFCYESRAIAFLVYKQGLPEQGKFLRLFSPDVSPLSSVSLWTKQGGILSIAGAEELSLQACDFSGNCSQARININPEVEAEKVCEESAGLNVSADFIASCTDGKLTWIVCGENGVLKSGEREIAYGCPSSGESINLGAWSVEVDEQSLFTRQIIALERVERESDLKSLVKVSDAVRILPDELLSINGVKLCITSSEPFSTKAGIYRLAYSGKSWLEGVEFSNDRKKLCARTKRAGIFAVFGDNIKPKIGSARITRGGFPESWLVEFPLSDVGSGIDYDRISAQFDGTPLVVEYMPYEGKARAYIHTVPSAGPTAGVHEISISVFDGAGNVANSVQQIKFSP